MKLKKWHREILAHRLECDGQQDVFDDFTATQIVDSQTRLLSIVQTGSIQLSELSELDKEVLTDAVEGSTYMFGAAVNADYGDISRSQFNAIENAMYELENFIED